MVFTLKSVNLYLFVVKLGLWYYLTYIEIRGGRELKLLKILVILVISAIFGGIILTGCENKGAVIAVVNGDKIYEKELNSMVSGLYGSVTEASEAEKESIFESLITSKLIEQEAKKRKLNISDKEVDEYMQEVIKANGVESKEAFYEQLKTTYGYSKSFVDNLIRSSMEERALYDDVITNDVKEDEAVIKKAYDDNPSKYKMVEVSHILISLEKSESEAAALSKAKSLVTRLITGEDFAALAKANSDDTGSAVNGGVISGFFGADNTTYVEEFVAASIKLNEGQFTIEPVLSQFGYHIIKADKVKSSFEDVKDYVTEIIYGPIREETFVNFIDKLKNDAKIERKMKFDLKKDEETVETDKIQ